MAVNFPVTTTIVWCHVKYKYFAFLIVVPSSGPDITAVGNVTSTSMKITWGMLGRDVSNGNITQYQVCYKASDKAGDVSCDLRQNVSGADNTTVLRSLNEATAYNIAVRARTLIGFGELGTTRNQTTLEDSK